MFKPSRQIGFPAPIRQRHAAKFQQQPERLAPRRGRSLIDQSAVNRRTAPNTFPPPNKKGGRGRLFRVSQ